MALTDQQQAYLMLVAFVLPAIIAWFGLGAPTDHTSLAILGAAILAGVLAAVKEALGTASPIKPAA